MRVWDGQKKGIQTNSVQDDAMARRGVSDHRSGVYRFLFKVRSVGEVWSGASMILVAQTHSERTFTFAKQVMHRSKAVPVQVDDKGSKERGREVALRLLFPELSSNWHASIRRKHLA